VYSLYVLSAARKLHLSEHVLSSVPDIQTEVHTATATDAILFDGILGQMRSAYANAMHKVDVDVSSIGLQCFTF